MLFQLIMKKWFIILQTLKTLLEKIQNYFYQYLLKTNHKSGRLITSHKQNNIMKAETLSIGLVAFVLLGILAIGVVFVQQVVSQGIVW